MREMSSTFSVQNGSKQPQVAVEHRQGFHVKIQGTKAQGSFLVVRGPRARVGQIQTEAQILWIFMLFVLWYGWVVPYSVYM